ncbi:hypothetical protein FACS1894177_02450 [Bacteroidia bacterium]|nr:hypothetical protein FACS1894177_02450 [Bacteroidia bacterium]
MKNLGLFLTLFCAVSFQLKAQTILSGNYKVTGTLQVENKLDILNTTPNTTQAILARLPDETSLEVKAYDTAPINCKLFSIENKFYYGHNNSAINFWRGGYQWGGWITFDVYDGSPMAKLSHYGLEVNGVVKAKEILISNTNWADFVFGDDYRLPSLNDVKLHINENKHLPGIPSEAEVKENGVNLGDMQVKLLQKIEELTLYTIQQQEMIDKLNARIEQLENK